MVALVATFTKADVENMLMGVKEYQDYDCDAIWVAKDGIKVESSLHADALPTLEAAVGSGKIRGFSLEEDTANNTTSLIFSI